MMLSSRSAQPLRRRRFGSRAGNAIVESALCIPFLLVIFLGIMEFGMGVYTYNFVSYAAREGARYASSRGSLSYSPATADDIRTRVRSQAAALDPSLVSVTTTWNPNNTPGNTVTVSVSYPITSIVGLSLGNITVGANSTMMIGQ